MSEIDSADLSRVQSPRPSTPEPSARQGRRNADSDVQLLDSDGAIGEKVYTTLLCHLHLSYHALFLAGTKSYAYLF